MQKSKPGEMDGSDNQKFTAVFDICQYRYI